MRWLFLFVLIVNISYVAWELTSTDVDVAVRKTSNAASSIVLLSEAGQAAAPEQPAKTEAEKVDTQPPVVSAEAGAGSVQAVAEPVTETTAEACYTLGPFRELEKLRLFTRAIKDYVAEPTYRSREEQEQSMFWVYLPPQVSLSKARALAERLEKVNIRDYYIISKGDQTNGVSLGHFKEKDRAYSHAETIRTLGFRPVVEPVFRTYTIYWLDYRVAPGLSVPESVFGQQLGGNVKRLDRPCA